MIDRGDDGAHDAPQGILIGAVYGVLLWLFLLAAAIEWFPAR